MIILKIFRILLVLIYVPIAATATVVVSLFRPFNPDNTRIGGWLFGVGAQKILGVRYIVEGRELVENMPSSIVVANHQDNMDLFFCGPVVPRRTVSVGKSSLKYLPFFGQAYWLSGNIMINRSKQQQSIDVLSQITEAIKQDDKSVWVFAEGTRNHGKGMGAFKKGAFHMALNAEVPIVPICVSTYAGKLDLGRWHSGTVIVRFLPPVDTNQYNEETLPELMALVHRDMSKAIEELDKRVTALEEK